MSWDFLKRGDELKNIETVVRQMMDGAGWKVVEDHFRSAIAAEYSALVSVKPENLVEAQTRIKITLDLMESIYKMAGMKFEWEGYKSLDAIYKEEEKSEFDRAQEESMLREYRHLREVENGRSN